MTLENDRRLARLYFLAFCTSDDSSLDETVALGFDARAIHVRNGTVIKPDDDDVRGPATLRGYIGMALSVERVNERINYRVFDIFRVSTTRPAEASDTKDRLARSQQLGVIPPTRDIAHRRAMPRHG